MKFSLILSIITIIIALILYKFIFKKKNDIKINILVAFITSIISIMILIFPLLEYKNILLKALISFIYGIKSIALSQDVSLLSKIKYETSFGFLYFIYISILFLITPALSVGVILIYLEKITNHIKLLLSKRKKLYVFSEINDKALILLKDIEKKENSQIIFTNVNEKNNTNIKAIKINNKTSNIKLNTNSEITFYMISENEDQNLNETLELIEKYKNRDKIKIYVVTNKEEASLILDSMDKGNITVEIINERERTIFNLLNTKPLFINSINKKISILIVGCGNIGKEFLKDSVWCSIMPDYEFEALVIDENADIIKEKINIEMPELLNNYNISFLNADIKSTKAINRIKENKNINYILVSLDNDEKNIDTAITLRRLFIREFNREPVINLYIENEFKKRQILSLVNEKGNKYNINAFGSINDIYSNNNIIDSELEKEAIQIHLSYDKDDKELKRYNLREYNKRSSRANALHIKYKLYSILEDKYSNDLIKDLEQFRKIYSKEIEEKLTKNEHDRWNAYTRSIGYIYASVDEVKKYYKDTNHHIHYLARMHPALVEFNELDNVSKELSKITSKKIDLVESDRNLVRYIYESYMK